MNAFARLKHKLNTDAAVHTVAVLQCSMTRLFLLAFSCTYSAVTQYSTFKSIWVPTHTHITVK